MLSYCSATVRSALLAALRACNDPPPKKAAVALSKESFPRWVNAMYVLIDSNMYMYDYE